MTSQNFVYSSDAPSTGFERIDGSTEEARTAVRARGFRPKQLLPYVPTPEALDIDERVDNAIAKSEVLLTEAKEQVAKPGIAPAELTPDEVEAKRQWTELDAEYRRKGQIIDEHLRRNQHLFQNVMSTISDIEAKGIPLPNCFNIINPSPFRGGGPLMPSTHHAHTGRCPAPECPVVDNKAAKAAEDTNRHSAQAVQQPNKISKATNADEITNPSPMSASAYSAASRCPRPRLPRPPTDMNTIRRHATPTVNPQEGEWQNVVALDLQGSRPAPIVLVSFALFWLLR